MGSAGSGTCRDHWIRSSHAILIEVDGQRSFDQITSILSEKYSAPKEQIAEDSSGFLDALRARRFLDVT